MINLPSPSPAPSSSRIFAGNLASRGPDEAAEQKTLKANFKAALFYGTLAVAALALYSFYFLYPNTRQFFQAPAALREIQSHTEEYEKVTLPNLTQSRDLKKAAYDEEFQQVEGVIAKILPADIDKLGLIKRLENFATAIQAKNPPFEFNSINFGKSIQEPGYTILPISTSIYSSTANFDRFLELVNLSGKLDHEIPIRLMAISNINIRYRGVDLATGEDKGVDFSVTLNAYSRSAEK